MDTATKAKIMRDYATHEGDTGSTEVQVAVLSARIKELTNHLKIHPKDKHSEHGLLQLVNRRRKLLKYLTSKSHSRYRELIKRLGLRR